MNMGIWTLSVQTENIALHQVLQPIENPGWQMKYRNKLIFKDLPSTYTIKNILMLLSL